MLATAVKYLTVYLSSMVKFIAGPVTGLATGLTYWESVLISVFGMMTSVLILTLLGPKLRCWVKRRLMGKQKRFTKSSRIFVRVWRRWGIIGVSFLTPLLLTPIGGALLANAYSGERSKILLYMLISAVFWSFVLSGVLYGGIQIFPV